MIFSEAGKELWRILDSAEGWQHPNKFRLVHEPSKTAWWIANGGFFFDGDDLMHTPACLGLIERHIIWRKAKKLANKMLAAQIRSSDAAGGRAEMKYFWRIVWLIPMFPFAILGATCRLICVGWQAGWEGSWRDLQKIWED